MGVLGTIFILVGSLIALIGLLALIFPRLFAQRPEDSPGMIRRGGAGLLVLSVASCGGGAAMMPATAAPTPASPAPASTVSNPGAPSSRGTASRTVVPARPAQVEAAAFPMSADRYLAQANELWANTDGIGRFDKDKEDTITSGDTAGGKTIQSCVTKMVCQLITTRPDGQVTTVTTMAGAEDGDREGTTDLMRVELIPARVLMGEHPDIGGLTKLMKRASNTGEAEKRQLGPACVQIITPKGMGIWTTYSAKPCAADPS